MVAGGTPRVGAQEAGLFTVPPAAPDGVETRRSGMGELRSRQVGIDVSRLPSDAGRGRGARLSLNLFDNAQRVAEIDRIDSVGNGRVFIGHVEGLADHVAGVNDNTVTLVLRTMVEAGILVSTQTIGWPSPLLPSYC